MRVKPRMRTLWVNVIRVACLCLSLSSKLLDPFYRLLSRYIFFISSEHYYFTIISFELVLQVSGQSLTLSFTIVSQPWGFDTRCGTIILTSSPRFAPPHKDKASNSHPLFMKPLLSIQQTVQFIEKS